MRFLKKIIKKLYHLIWFLGVFFLFVPSVYAEPSISNFSINSNHIQPNSSYIYATPSSNRLRFDIQSDGQITYVRSIFCYDTKVTSWSTNLPSTQLYDVIFYNTNQRCPYYNQSFEGYVMYFYATYEPINNPSVSVDVTFNTVRDFSLNLISYSVSHTPYQYIFSQPDESVQVNIDTNGIINSQNQSSQNIINNQDSNTQDIINNQDSNTQDIINNQDSNTQQQIESQKVCTQIDKTNITTDNYFLDTSGNTYPSNAYGITDYIKINNSTLKVLSNSTSLTSGFTCFYNSNKTLISCTRDDMLGSNVNITPPNNSYYFRSSIHKSQNLPLFEICSNGNQVINDELGNLNSNITDDSAPSIDLNLSVSSDTPISDLITMPLTILNTLIQTLDGSCTNYTIPFFYNNTLTFPCFTISDYLGSTVTNYIDLFICFYMCYNIAMLCISVFEDITSLRDIYDSMYEPKHAYSGYQPRHAKGGAN